MKTRRQLHGLSLLLVLTLASQTLAWECNIKGFREGWTRNHSFLDVNDGFLIVTAPANSNTDVRIVSPTGPYDSNRISGVYAMVRARQDATELSGAGVRSWTADHDYRDPEGQHALASEFVGDPNHSELMYADLLALQGQTLYNIGLNFPKNGPEDVEYEVDWVRWEGLYIDNESFEYWDTDADAIANWTASAAYDFPDDLPPETVHGRSYAATLTGTGQSETISQDIKGAADLLEGQEMIIYAALLVPGDAAGTEVILNIAEQGKDGNWSTGTPIAVETQDSYFDVAVETTLQLAPADRTGLRLEVSIKCPEGKKVYLDDVFVDDATQDWVVEARFPWAELTGDFQGDLAQGDQDGNGRNVFPPEIGQICGFVLVAIDQDASGGGNQSWTQGGQRPWSNIGQCAAQPMTFIGPAQ